MAEIAPKAKAPNGTPKEREKGKTDKREKGKSAPSFIHGSRQTGYFQGEVMKMNAEILGFTLFIVIAFFASVYPLYYKVGKLEAKVNYLCSLINPKKKGGKINDRAMVAHA